MKKLTPRQEAFVREYLKHGNGTRAAIEAGYSPSGADVQAVRLLGNASVKAEIARRGKRIEERAEISAAEVLREMKRIAMADISQAYDENGNLKKIHEIPEDVRRAIAGVEVDELWAGGRERTQIGETRKLKFWDKTKALDQLARHLSLFNDKVEHTHHVTLDQLLDEGGADE
jgi:phage terminase small subunit